MMSFSISADGGRLGLWYNMKIKETNKLQQQLKGKKKNSQDFTSFLQEN